MVFRSFINHGYFEDHILEEQAPWKKQKRRRAVGVEL